jgi:hypothetical protein
MFEYNFDGDENGSLTITYENIIKSKQLMPVTRTLAMDLSMCEYLSVGDFFKSLSDFDVQNLLEISEDENSDKFSEIALIAEMLAGGEGLVSFEGGNTEKGLESFAERINTFCGFIAIESLYRKGLIKVYHENMSFGSDMGSKIIVEKL